MSAIARRRPRFARGILVALFAVAAVSCGRREEDPGAALPESRRDAQRMMTREWPVYAWYEGVLPCPDCAGIRTELVLYADRPAFLLRETWLGPIERTYTTTGAWTTVHGSPEDPEAVIYRLEAERSDETRYFLVVDARTLRMLDREQRPLVTDVNTFLARIDPVEGG